MNHLKLRRKVEEKTRLASGKLNITMVDKKDKHYFSPVRKMNKFYAN